jgi:hypothetical protein
MTYLDHKGIQRKEKSPENFHELIICRISGTEIISLKDPNAMFYQFDSRRDISLDTLQQAVNISRGSSSSTRKLETYF